MKLQRDNYETLKNKSAALAFRKVTKSNFPEEYIKLSWNGLHEERSRITKDLNGILKTAENDGRDLNQEESLAFRFGEEAIDALNEEFNLREERGTKDPVDLSNRFYRPSVQTDTDKPILTNSKTYRGMFYGNERASLDKADFESFNEFMELAASGKYEPRLEKRTFMEKDGPGGGYSVPSETAAIIVDRSLEQEIVRPRAQVWPMKSESLAIPSWDNDNRTEHIYGGFNGTWLGENQESTVQTGKLRLKTLTAHKLGIHTEASRELLQDGIGFGEQISMGLSGAMGFYLDQAFLTGSGVGRPKGVINSPSRINVVRNTTGIDYNDVTSMFGRLHPGCHQNACWIMNYQLLPRMMKMKDDSSAIIWSPIHSYGIAGPIPTALFGREIIWTEKLPGVGHTGDVVLADLSQYAIGMRQELVIERSNAPGWTRDVESFRAILRVDGDALWKNPITPANGDETLSWAVCLSTSTYTG
jgi:HK97 family phage major capsid protein